MSTIKRFEDIRAWQEARILANTIYGVSRLTSFKRDYSFIDQLRRAAVSIPSNIAEGYGRGGNKEFLYFLSIASGSLREVQSLLYLALDQQYISQNNFDTIYEHSELVSNIIGAFMKYIKQANIRGIRYLEK